MKPSKGRIVLYAADAHESGMSVSLTAGDEYAAIVMEAEPGGYQAKLAIFTDVGCIPIEGWIPHSKNDRLVAGFWRWPLPQPTGVYLRRADAEALLTHLRRKLDETQGKDMILRAFIDTLCDACTLDRLRSGEDADRETYFLSGDHPAKPGRG